MGGYETQFILSYFAIADRLDDLILQWLEVSFPGEAVQNLDEQRAHMWRGVLIRQLVRAHLMHNTTRGVDTAVDMFSKFCARQDHVYGTVGLGNSAYATTKISPVLHVLRWPAIVELSTNLGSASLFQTSAAKWDRFVKTVSPTERRVEKTLFLLWTSILLASSWYILPSSIQTPLSAFYGECLLIIRPDTANQSCPLKALMPSRATTPSRFVLYKWRSRWAIRKTPNGWRTRQENSLAPRLRSRTRTCRSLTS